jgi:hypothetical protein
LECGEFLETIAGRIVDGITLRYARKLDNQCGHYFRL